MPYSCRTEKMYTWYHNFAYFDESFRQLNTATTIPISTVIGPMTDHVVVLLIGLPRRTPNPCSAHTTPKNARINPIASVTMKSGFISRA